NRVLGFLVHSVERIVNMNWEDILPPPQGVGTDHYLTAVTHVDGQMVEIIDGEKVLAEAAPVSEQVSVGVGSVEMHERTAASRVLIVDASSVAGKQTVRRLQGLGIELVAQNDGRQALDYLKGLSAEGKKPSGEFMMMISDIEMPEMDGYTLTTEVRQDPA